VSAVQLHLIALVAVPLAVVLIAYVTRWIAGFFFTAREAELVGLTCSLALMAGSEFRATSTYYVVLGLIGFALGIYVLHKLWRPSRRAGAVDNG
jgi:hypothetical protein